MEEEKKICCVIGYLAIPADKLDDVKRELEREFGAALEDGYRKFLTSFTEGAGMLFARCVNERRESYPDIFLEVVLNPEHCGGFDRDNEWVLLSKSNGIRGLCEECKQNYPLSVTRELVQQSDRVIAVCGGQDDNDTLYAMDYARTMEQDLRIIKI